MDKRYTPDHVYRDVLYTLEVMMKDRRGTRESLDEQNLLFRMTNELMEMRQRDSEKDERATYARLKAKFETPTPGEG